MGREESEDGVMLRIPGGPEDFVAVMGEETLVNVERAGGWQFYLAQLLMQEADFLVQIWIMSGEGETLKRSRRI